MTAETCVDLLLVDDNPIDVAFFRRAVRKTGLDIQVRTVTAGQSAIDYLEAKGEYSDRYLYPLPDVVVLDLRMPEFNGFDFLAWRKASTLFSAIPVIIFTGSRDEEDIERVLELGANRHIVKPQALQNWETVVRQIWEVATEGTNFFRAERSRRAANH